MLQGHSASLENDLPKLEEGAHGAWFDVGFEYHQDHFVEEEVVA